MFLLRKPSCSEVENFLKQQAGSTFSYPDVGATRSSTAPKGYIIDHNRVFLDRGEESWHRAMEAIRSWSMFEMTWLELCWPCAPIEEATDKTRRFGFAYGTLPEHSESGEERFCVEWDLADDSVWYDIFAFSRPLAFLARAASPLSRTLQKRFARDSQLAMVNRVRRS
jgi:uncharacterized protein (UPF0548 family)